MDGLIQKSEIILTELNRFSDEMIYLGPPINDDRLEIFEQQLGYMLPADFKFFLKKHNGIALHGVELYGIDKELRGSSLDEVYIFEHRADLGNPMPKQLLPFSPDGRGNHYCLDLSELNNGACPVLFWQHDFIYGGFEEVEVCYLTFSDWVKEEMIEWVLEDYNYDGSEK